MAATPRSLSPAAIARRLRDFALHDPVQVSSTAAYNATISRSVSYDPLGRIESQVNGLSGRRYTYDNRGRLLSDSLIEDIAPTDGCPGGTEVDENGDMCITEGGWQATSGEEFAYDSAGNRVDKNGIYLTGNRITQFDGCSYITDNDGNVTSRTCAGQTITLSWTAENRLATLMIGGVTRAFHYDANGRLVRNDVSGTPSSHLLWDGADLLAELNGSGTAAGAEFSYYDTLDKLHALVVGGQQYNAQEDAIGNIIALTDGAQTLKRTYGYDAWGELMGGSDIRPFNNADRPRFKGALWLGPDMDVYYMRARWYEPKSGRFLSEDPIGLAGGLNPYAYAGSDPVNGRDPLGLRDCKGWWDSHWDVTDWTVEDEMIVPKDVEFHDCLDPPDLGDPEEGGNPLDVGGGGDGGSAEPEGPSCGGALATLAVTVLSDATFFLGIGAAGKLARLAPRLLSTARRISQAGRYGDIGRYTYQASFLARDAGSAAYLSQIPGVVFGDGAVATAIGLTGGGDALADVDLLDFLPIAGIVKSGIEAYHACKH